MEMDNTITHIPNNKEAAKLEKPQTGI